MNIKYMCFIFVVFSVITWGAQFAAEVGAQSVYTGKHLIDYMKVYRSNIRFIYSSNQISSYLTWAFWLSDIKW